MDSNEKLLLNSYYQLIVLTEQQSVVANKPRHDEQLAELQRLEEQKNSIIEMINELNVKNNQNTSNNRVAIVAIVEKMIMLNDQLHQKLTNWYIEDSQSMKQVSTQRKTLQTYGGLHNSDIVSFYFDEKK